MVNNHGEFSSPKWGCQPLPNGHSMAYKLGLLTTYKSWDDPPSSLDLFSWWCFFLSNAWPRPTLLAGGTRKFSNKRRDPTPPPTRIGSDLIRKPARPLTSWRGPQLHLSKGWNNPMWNPMVFLAGKLGPRNSFWTHLVFQDVAFPFFDPCLNLRILYTKIIFDIYKTWTRRTNSQSDETDPSRKMAEKKAKKL